MAQLDIRGQVLHMPGPWGLAVGASNLPMEIVDADIGNTNDTIWRGITDASGNYSGRTADWRDSHTVSVRTPKGTVQRNIADPTDVMALTANLSQRIGQQNHQLTVPFIPALAGSPQPPIILPWPPPGTGGIIFDGTTAITSLDQFATLMRTLFGAGAAVAQAGIRHEIVINTQYAARLRSEINQLDGALGALLNDIISATAADRERDRARTANVQHDLNTVAGRKRQVTTAVVGAAQATWEPVRQKLIALVRSFEAAARLQCTYCQQIGMVIVAIVMVLISTAVTAITPAAATGPGLIVAAVGAVVMLAATLVSTLPSLLAAAGMTGAAAEMQQWLDSNTWFGTMLLVILIVCSLVMMMAITPAAGWRWLVENVGERTIRFVFTGTL